MKHHTFLLFAALGTATLPTGALACACGCGIFDVGTSGMLPTGTGGTAFLEYDYSDQDRNWSGKSGAPGANNDDKVIRGEFYTAGLQYMFNRSWGVQAEVPYVYRYYRGTEDDGLTGAFNHGAVGDVRLEGIYSGFSADMSTGITFGLKLPTGDYQYPDFDRDTEIGTGSTDTLLGAYHLDKFSFNPRFGWFAQASWDHPVLISAGYRPGDEIDGASGVYYEMGKMGIFTNVAPVLQVIGSGRFHDSGGEADPYNTGYTRAYISPGIQANLGRAMVYADVELPVYQYMNGNQLVAPALFKVILSYNF